MLFVGDRTILGLIDVSFMKSGAPCQRETAPEGGFLDCLKFGASYRFRARLPTTRTRRFG
jgi:hypothetical protein